MANERKPRLCIMAKGDSGYGFHLHGEKGKNGQYIRKVEPGSPAEASGMRAGDRVVAVNGVNVERETHHQASASPRVGIHIDDCHSCYRMGHLCPQGMHQQVVLADWDNRDNQAPTTPIFVLFLENKERVDFIHFTQPEKKLSTDKNVLF